MKRLNKIEIKYPTDASWSNDPNPNTFPKILFASLFKVL